MGYAVWPEVLVEGATRLAVNCHSCVNAATQYAGISALEGPQDEVESMVTAFDQRREVIVNGLNRLPGFRCRTPGGAFYAFPNIEETALDARSLQKMLLEEAGVATVAGTSFGHFEIKFNSNLKSFNLNNGLTNWTEVYKDMPIYQAKGGTLVDFANLIYFILPNNKIGSIDMFFGEKHSSNFDFLDIPILFYN